TRDSPSRFFDHALGLVARVIGQRSGEHKLFPFERTRAVTGSLLLLEPDARLAELGQHFLVALLAEEPRHALADLGADLEDFFQFFPAGVRELVERAEVLGQELRRALAYERNPQGEDKTREDR